MKYEDALRFVTTNGVALTLDAENGVNGMAIGRKDGGALSGTTDFCVTAFVTQKLTDDELNEQSTHSFERAFTSAMGHPPERETDIDVVDIGGSFALQNAFVVPSLHRGRHGGSPLALNAQKPFASLRCGIGITNPVGAYPHSLSVGTAGFYMKDDSGNIYVVSNNHVIGGSNAASLGDMVVQPGTLDFTSHELTLMPTVSSLAPVRIGDLTAIVQLSFQNPTNAPINRVDAALAKVDTTARNVNDTDRLTFSGSIRGIAHPYEVDNAGALIGSARVYKVGRTTGYTEGTVTNIAAVVSIPYPGGVAVFSDQIAVHPTADNVGPFSDRGDSGSGVLNDRHELVGLLFAGSPSRTLTNPIDQVITELSNASGISSLKIVHV